VKKLGFFIIAVLVMSLAGSLLLGGCSPEDTQKLKVVTSTSLISSIVERVGGDEVDMANIIPPAQCPGHFDVKPGDIQSLADADLFLMHGWQGEKFADDLIASAQNPDLTVVRLDIPSNPQSNWMTPPVQIKAIDKITDSLCQVDTKNNSAYLKSAAALADKIEAKGAEIKTRLAEVNPASVNVMCAEMQAGFVRWAGFNIIATYGRPDSLTPQVVKELVDKGREGKVTLIIDNMQSGKDAGAGIAEELGCARVILSNFPGCFENTGTWEKAVEYNVDLLMGAIGQ